MAHKAYFFAAGATQKKVCFIAKTVEPYKKIKQFTFQKKNILTLKVNMIQHIRAFIVI